MENNQLNIQNKEETAVSKIEKQVEINNQQNAVNVDQINSVVEETSNVEEVINNANTSNKKDKKNNKPLVIILIILVLALLGVGGYFVWDKYIKEDTNKGNSNNQNNITPQVTPTHEITPIPIIDDNTNTKLDVGEIKFEDELNNYEEEGKTYIYIYKVNGYEHYYATKNYGQLGYTYVDINDCELVKKYKCLNENCTYDGVSDILITDGERHFNYNGEYDKIIDTTKEINIYSDDKINIGILDSKYFMVNGNKVDFYKYISEVDDSYDTEDSLYYYSGSGTYFPINYNGIRSDLLMSITYCYQVIDDVVFVSVGGPLSGDLFYDFLVDKNGNIIKFFNDGKDELSFSTGIRRIEYSRILRNDNSASGKINGNELYFRIVPNESSTFLYSHWYPCSQDENAVAYYVDKLTYLGNNEFKIDNKLDTVTFGNVITKSSIDCEHPGQTTR